MRKNAKKCTQVCTVHGLYLSNSLFSKDSIEQMSLNVKNIKFGDTNKTIGTTLLLFRLKMFLEAIPTRLQSWKKLCRRKLEKLPKKIQKEEENSFKKSYCCHGFYLRYGFCLRVMKALTRR